MFKKKAVSLNGLICLVVGVSNRGVGKGIAKQLVKAGATVYITSGTRQTDENSEESYLQSIAKEIDSKSNKCLAIQCDFSSYRDIRNLFERIDLEQDGQLDVLVNNNYAAVQIPEEKLCKSFWEHPVELWDAVNNVALRNHYLCNARAAKLMVTRKRGLLINISSSGNVKDADNLAINVRKEICDKLSVSLARELQKHNVCCVSLCPGVVRMELIERMYIAEFERYESNCKATKKLELMLTGAESSQFTGIAVVHLASDKSVMRKSGQVLLTTDLAKEYGFKDIDDQLPADFRSISFLLKIHGWPWLAMFIPSFVKVPQWLMTFFGYNV
ncbi:hypothetical protein HELRODRAFT_192551 [Helobdella robusta]|uniref:Dehydrogenase/reductase SDR family member 1 n=1 Tax=Helobdella robusta TaxID=6412 RepID=T1FU25_HELRO|nr:hypothetical protein HELRODRAFT_192551 [Helobdella robusta]ESO00623.1 hypothetical protein HELRODRAFT_192551 [Helobdella robusta]